MNPIAQYIADPLMDNDGIVHAEFNLKGSIKRKYYIDPVRQDSRLDVIRLDAAEGYFTPYGTGFPTIKTEIKEVERYWGKEVVNDRKARVDRL